VRGFVRLSIHQPFALGTPQQSLGPFNVRNLARVVFEIGFGQIPMQMSLADGMELPVNSPL